MTFQKFKVIYKIGKELREKTLLAKDLDDAEVICNLKNKKWIDIIQLQKTKKDKNNVKQ